MNKKIALNPINFSFLTDEVEFSSDFERSFIKEITLPKKIKVFPIKIKQINSSLPGDLFDQKEKKKNYNIQ